jgi:hypothetical protein
MAEEKKKIGIEGVLTITATEYCSMVGKELSDYVPKGVSMTNNFKGNLYNSVGDLKMMPIFLSNVPENAEVVVNYRDSISFNGEGYRGACNTATITVSAHGTALIPKKFNKNKYRVAPR